MIAALRRTVGLEQLQPAPRVVCRTAERTCRAGRQPRRAEPLRRGRANGGIRAADRRPGLRHRNWGGIGIEQGDERRRWRGDLPGCGLPVGNLGLGLQLLQLSGQRVQATALRGRLRLAGRTLQREIFAAALRVGGRAITKRLARLRGGSQTLDGCL